MVFNKDVHDYNTRHKNNIRKPHANQMGSLDIGLSCLRRLLIYISITSITDANKFKNALYKMDF